MRIAQIMGGAALLASCSSAPPSYQEVQELFGNSCAVGTSSCHTPGGMGHLDLSATAWYASTVRARSSEVGRLSLVEPGHPESSYLMLKLANAMATLLECQAHPEDCGAPMPMVTG